MKVKVVKEYIDRYDGAYHAPGETVEMTGKRFGEIKKEGHYVVLIEKDDPTEQQDIDKEQPDAEDLEHRDQEEQTRQKKQPRGRKKESED